MITLPKYTDFAIQHLPDEWIIRKYQGIRKERRTKYIIAEDLYIQMMSYK